MTSCQHITLYIVDYTNTRVYIPINFERDLTKLFIRWSIGDLPTPPHLTSLLEVSKDTIRQRIFSVYTSSDLPPHVPTNNIIIYVQTYKLWEVKNYQFFKIDFNLQNQNIPVRVYLKVSKLVLTKRQSTFCKLSCIFH